MRIIRFSGAIFSMLLAFYSSPVLAEALKDTIAGLEVLPLAYGATELKINHQDVLISKAVFRSETAGGGDGYSVIIKDDKGWQFVRAQGKPGNDIMIWSAPHTGEDAVTSIYFMVPKGVANSKDTSSLYVLEAHRNYKQSLTESAQTTFKLLKLESKNDDFGIRFFTTLATGESKSSYGASDIAVHQELNLH